MAGRYTQLSKALTEELSTRLADAEGVAVDRRLLPRRDRTEFATGGIYVSVFAAAAGFEVVGRQVDEERWEAVLAIQSAAPDNAVKAGDNPFGNVTSLDRDHVDWGDQVFDLVERIKGFWRAETESEPAGPLRDLPLAGCTFVALEHDPVYVPFHLEELGILSIVLQLTYQVTDEGDDDE